MGFLDDLTTASAEILLDIITELDVTVSYIDGTGTHTIYAMPDSLDVTSALAGNAIGDFKDKGTFYVPVQTGFQPTKANDCNDNKVVWNTVTYRVVSTKTGAVAGVYELTCEALTA